MKALIAAGGRATRLRPITWTTNKHLIPLGGKPMLQHVIEKIVDAGITEIVINVNPGELDLMRNAFGDGSRWGVNLTYVEQIGGAKGIAHVVANAEEFLKDDSFVFFLGDNILLGGIRHLKDRFEKENLDSLIALSRVKDPQRFGVPELDENGRVLRMFEKPEVPPSPFAVTGIYFFSPEYFEAFKTAKPSARGEYEIMEVINWYITNRVIGSEEITGWWKDTGTPDALLEGNALVMKDLPASYYTIETEVPESARIEGPVKIGKGTVIGENVLIRGPVVIGENGRVEASYIGPYTSIGHNVVLKNAEIEHSILMNNVRVETPRRIIDSIMSDNSSVQDHLESHPHNGHRMFLGENSFVEL